MYDLLSGLSVVEVASFVAAPSCCLHLRRMGAEVIRVETIGGGPDFTRWPRGTTGASLYWEGLNKGKKSVAIDLANPKGRELAVALATAPGDGAGILVTNFPLKGFLAHARLTERRRDMISVRVMGWADGRNAVDYTVNSALGVPLVTGPSELGDDPVNHVLPAWDIATGLHAALATLAVERRRRATGEGAEIRVPLGDVALATLGDIGQIAEVMATGADRPRIGNDIFGAFGRDFATADGRRVMLVGLTSRQWADLVGKLELRDEIAAVETALGVDFSEDEGLRFEHRDRLNPLFERAVAARSLCELKRFFEGSSVCWGPYATLKEAIADHGLLDGSNPLFSTVRHGSGAAYPTPGAAVTIVDSDRAKAVPAPRLGQHTDEVLATVLALSKHEIANLHDTGIVAGPATSA